MLEMKTTFTRSSMATTVHPRLSEQLRMKFWNNCSDKLNTWMIEDANFSRSIENKGEQTYSTVF